MAAAGAGGMTMGAGAMISGAGPAEAAAAACPPTPAASAVTPSDPRYWELVTRGYNALYLGSPASVHLVHNARQIERAVTEAVRAGKRIAVRSGGHCFENFVDNADVNIVLDISEMNAVYYDPEYKAFAVEAGATLGQAYRTLYLGWGVTIPGGACPSVGAGGHIAGGGYGMLSRRHGLSVDHLYGVEVVVVDRSGHARVVTATREPGDPHHDLWWAHTGGGGGCFGVVTRYLLRSPGASGADPAALLPKPPARVAVMSVSWPWDRLNEQAFLNLVGNYGDWYARNRDADSPLDSSLMMRHHTGGPITLSATVDSTQPDPEGRLTRFIGEIKNGVGAEPSLDYVAAAPWLRLTLAFDSTTGGAFLRFKSKAAYLRAPWSARQVSAVHRFLSQGPDNPGAAIYLNGYGGRVNSVAPRATAAPHRDSIMLGLFDVGWWSPVEDAARMASVRGVYHEVYRDTGGVPVPNDHNDGSYINYPDLDLADPQWNTSGVPWHTLYYKDAYPRLQDVKARYDPGDVFRHALSVRLPGRQKAAPSTAEHDRGRSASRPDLPATTGRPVPPRRFFEAPTR